MSFNSEAAKTPKNIAILGSTGSIGKQTLQVVAAHPDKLSVRGISCNANTELMEAQAAQFGVHQTAVGAIDALRLIEDPEVDIVVNALVGAAGLRASLLTLQSGKVLALANKESLVVGGDLIMPLALSMKPGSLMPIDSEHGAIFQCLIGENMSEVARLWITASGGPFRGKSADELASVTSKEALAHPTWNMGKKISIDSSTLMNKGLEVIEAHHLFQVPFNQIQVVVQPQSAIHSMVEFVDGSVKAHLGVTDMRIPIQFALSWPERWPSPADPIDFRSHPDMNFEAPELNTFKCLHLAIEAGTIGKTMPCVMNAANEVAVDSFLRDQCDFLDIARCVEYVMEHHSPQAVESVEQLEKEDEQARILAQSFLAHK